MSDKPRWADLFGMDPDYNKEALEAERAKLFEVFKAGWDAHGQFSLPDDLAEAFDAWLQEQVDEVDVLGREEQSAEKDAGLVEQIARVIVEHQRIPTFERDFENRCSGCDHLRGESDGPNSPRHAQHVAEQIVARVFPPAEEDEGRRYMEGSGAKPTPEEVAYMESLKDEDLPVYKPTRTHDA